MEAKSYSSKSAAVAAIRKQGLQNVFHEIEERGRRFYPKFLPETAEDVAEIRRRGFYAYGSRVKKAAE